MKNKKTGVSNPRRGAAAGRTSVRAWLGALVLTLMSASAFAGVREVRVQVDGLACPFCAYNIEKRFKTLNGVDHEAGFEVNTEQGYARFTWVSAVPFDPAEVSEQIRKSGFTPAGIELSAEGTVSLLPAQDQAPAGLILISPTTDQSPLLISDGRADRAQNFQALQAIARRPGSAPFKVRVQGAVVVEEDGTWRLALYRWEPLAFGARVELDVEGMTCEQCSLSLMKTLSGSEGVIHVQADHDAGRVQVWTDSGAPDADAFSQAVQDAGFKATASRTVRPGQEPDDDR